MSTVGKTINCKAAISWGANEKLSLEDIEVAPPQRGEVRVKIEATGIVRIKMYLYKKELKTKLKIFSASLTYLRRAEKFWT